MIVDAHTHAWRRWPYAPVDDPDRGDVDQLLATLDANEVERALIVCARISGGDERTANPDNNDYASEAAQRHPDRLIAAIDVDSRWLPEYHMPGVLDRLAAARERTDARVVTHYLADEDDGWFDFDEGAGFLRQLADDRILLSLHAGPAWFPALSRAADRGALPSIMLHHQGHVRDDTQVSALLALASVPEITVKVSGFHYLDDRSPSPGALARFGRVLERFGPSRLAWGSDFPVAPHRYTVSYPQTLEILDLATADLDEDGRADIRGGTARRLLMEADAW